VSRSVTQNVDLHYISMVQMSQMLQATQRHPAVLKVCVKILLCLSVDVARARFSPKGAEETLLYIKELSKQIGVCLQSSMRLSRWMRKHLRPFDGSSLLAQPCVWSFEEMPEHVEDGKDGVRDPRPNSRLY